MALYRHRCPVIGSSKDFGAVVRFVDSGFDEQKTPAEIQRLFGTVKDVHHRALSLRAIFLAMARNQRRPNLCLQSTGRSFRTESAQRGSSSLHFVMPSLSPVRGSHEPNSFTSSKKDARRHWPRILILPKPHWASLPATNSTLGRKFQCLSSFSPFFSFSQVATSLRPRNSFSGHSSLFRSRSRANPWSGDPNGAVTKPYGWRNLLGRPNSFSSSFFISVPLFHMHLLLLHHFRLSPSSQTSRPSRNATRPVLLFTLFCLRLLLASSQKNFGQLLLTAACILLAAIGVIARNLQFAWSQPQKSASARRA